MDLGARIAAWRRAKGLLQKQLAEAVGVSVGAVCMWEGSGKHRTSPTSKNVEAVVKALGLTMVQFYGRIPKAKAVA